MAKMQEMNADFARWYTEAFMDDGAKRDLRWKGVIDVASKADHRTVEVLTRLAFQTPVSAAGRKNEGLGDIYNGVISRISGGDTSFNPPQATRELQILAAATLVRLFATLPDAGLAVTTAFFGGSRRLDLPMDLAGLAEKALITLSGRKHARTDLNELELAAPEISFSAAPEAFSSLEPTLWKAQLDQLHEATGAAIKRVVSGQNRVIGLLHRQILLDEEELQMLWWLLGGYSRHLDKPFSEIETTIKPWSLARDLGEMTAVSPGPASARAILSRAGIGTQQLKIGDAVNAADLDWAKMASNSELVSPVTTPIHFALEQRAELGSTDAWQAGWSTLTGLAAGTELPAIKLAELFYREHLFLFVSD